MGSIQCKAAFNHWQVSEILRDLMLFQKPIDRCHGTRIAFHQFQIERQLPVMFFKSPIHFFENLAIFQGNRLSGKTQPGRKTSDRSEEHTSELQSLMRISYAVLCLKKK